MKQLQSLQWPLVFQDLSYRRIYHDNHIFNIISNQYIVKEINFLPFLDGVGKTSLILSLVTEEFPDEVLY